MNKEKMFITFLESLRDEKNTHMIDAITEGFALTEGFRLPDIKNGAADAIDASKGRMGRKSAEKLSDAQVAERKDKFAREEKSAKQQNWRVAGSMASIVKFAKVQPLDVEKWMDETLKPAIKEGKQGMDQQFGTNSAKRGILDRVKSAAKSFTEAEEPKIASHVLIINWAPDNTVVAELMDGSNDMKIVHVSGKHPIKVGMVISASTKIECGEPLVLEIVDKGKWQSPRNEQVGGIHDLIKYTDGSSRGGSVSITMSGSIVIGKFVDMVRRGDGETSADGWKH